MTGELGRIVIVRCRRRGGGVVGVVVFCDLGRIVQGSDKDGGVDEVLNERGSWVSKWEEEVKGLADCREDGAHGGLDGGVVR